jgi:general secretion pathway protein K
LFRRIEPALTVYSGRQFVDPQVAPREALRALPNMSPNDVESVLAARASQQSALTGTATDLATSLRGRAFTIRAELERADRTTTIEAAVRLTDDPTNPYWLLSWRAR